MCRGDLIWIAEADDIAQVRFLSELIPAFQDPSVALAFCQSKQIDEAGNPLSDDYLTYTRDVSDQWEHDYVRDGLKEIREALSIKNTLPNVSAVLFKAATLRRAISEIGENLFEYRVAGDWLVYVHVLRYGKLSYSALPLNSHRRHTQSVTSSLDAVRHVEEVMQVQKLAQDLSDADAEIVRRADTYVDSLVEHFGISREGSGKKEDILQS